MARARASSSLVCTITTPTERAPTRGLTISGKADALDEGGLLSWKTRVGRCKPVIPKEPVGQVLVVGDPHDIWIADNHVGSEPRFPARAVLGEKEQLEVRAGNDHIGPLAVEDVFESLHVRRIARHRNEMAVARPVEARRKWVRVGGHDDRRQRQLHQRSDDSLAEQSPAPVTSTFTLDTCGARFAAAHAAWRTGNGGSWASLRARLA